jgi:hypothetical protein
MSASLENQFISDRYTSLLHLSGSSITGVLDSVHDGLGNATPIQISDARVVIGAGSSIIDVNEDEASVSINNIQLPTASTATTLYDVIFPVNSIYLTATNINPSNSFSGTVWELVSEGRYLAGIGTDSDKNGEQETIREGSNLDTFGEYKHTLTESEIPSHSHEQNNRIESSRQLVDRSLGISVQRGRSDDIDDGNSSLSTKTTSTGGSQSHNNAPPYFGVYVWKRTS